MRRCGAAALACMASLVFGAQPVQAERGHGFDVLMLAGKGKPSGTYRTYDWRWADGPVYVYDGTGDSRWGVAAAVTGWRASGVDVRLSAGPCTGCIDVSQGVMPDAYWGGYAEWTTSGGYALECRVVLNVYKAGAVYARHIALHEVGHCLSMAHNSGDIRKSAMNATVSADTYVTVPSRGDLSTLATHYGL